MTSVAVIGGDTRVGERIVATLREDPRVARLVVLGAQVEAQADVEAHAVDIAATDLKAYLDGIDVIVECATRIDPMPERDLVDRTTVMTADNVLRAAASARRYVLVSTTAVYGAWANNAVPLNEDALLRPNAGFDPATRAAEVERRVREWNVDHPDCDVVVLRAAPVVATDSSDLMAVLLAGRPPVVARGAHPLVQVVHVDDVASAVGLAVFGSLTGVYNVAADDALDEDDLAALLPGRTQVRLPEELIARGLDALWQSGAGDVPAAALAYLREPWTVANEKLRAAGWEPEYANAEAIAVCMPEAAYALPPEAKRALLAAAATAGAVVVATALFVNRRRKRRRARRNR